MNIIEFIGRSLRDFKSCREEVSYHSPKLIYERMKEGELLEEKYVEEGTRKKLNREYPND